MEVRVLDDSSSIDDPSSTSLKEGCSTIVSIVEWKLETLRNQYEEQLESLRSEIDRSRKRRHSKENGEGGDDSDGSSDGKKDEQKEKDKLVSQGKPVSQLKESLEEKLPGDQKGQLDTLVTSLDEQYQEQLVDMQRQHVDDVEDQVKAMRDTLEEIYNSQVELMRSELEQSHQTAMLDQRETLDKERKDQVNELEQEWTRKLEDLKQDYEQQLVESKLGDSLAPEDSAEFITNLNQKLTEEHRRIIQKIEEDLESQPLTTKHRESKDSQTDEESVASTPVTQHEFQKAHDKHSALKNAEDVQKSLENQVEEISSLRAQMLGEYEQMLSVRSEAMASQSEEVQRLQEEMARIQQQYEDQMAEFQQRVTLETEASVKSELSTAHSKELEDMKTYYETKVSDIEQTYTTDIAQLKQEHEDLLNRLQQESSATSEMLSSPTHAALGKQREYVRRTTTLTAISDEDDTPPSSPPPGESARGSDYSALEERLKKLESKLRDKETILAEVKKRLEAETTNAEDLHGKLLDSNKVLEEYEESLKSKSEEIDELQSALINKEGVISQLEHEKAELEEKGEKDKGTIETGDGDNKLLGELKEKVEKLEKELAASKDVNVKIKAELSQMDAQHGEAVMKLKEEIEESNRLKMGEAKAAFEIQLEEELNQQAEELDDKYKSEISRHSQELQIYKQTESELKTKLSQVQAKHEKQLNKLKETFEQEGTGKKYVEVVNTMLEDQEVVKAELASSELASSSTDSFDRESVESSIRESVRSELVQDYEESIDKLKTDYEAQISDLNGKLHTLESESGEKGDVEKEASDAEKSDKLKDTDVESIKEALRQELEDEYKDKLQVVTDNYESKLKHLQDIVDGKKEVPKSPSLPQFTLGSPTAPKQQSPPFALARSRSLDRMPGQERPKIPQEYEGYVSTIRREYEDKINSLQKEIAQYKSSVGPVPLLSPLMPMSPKARLLVKPASPDSGSDVPVLAKPQAGSVELRQEIYDEIAAEFELSFKALRTDYEKQLEEVNAKLVNLQSDSSVHGDDLESRIRAEIIKEYEEKMAELREHYEAKISEMENSHETEVERLKDEVESAKSEKTIAEQKVKSSMMVWHEEVVSQLKKKQVENISQLRREFEEKMELYREEVQEEVDTEKHKLVLQHKQEVAELEERYDNLVEGLRTGEVPEVAELVQEKFDMELEMAKSLIQQECDETIESEQSRLSEQFDEQLSEALSQKEEELTQQKAKHEKELSDLRSNLEEQYESQISELKEQLKSDSRATSIVSSIETEEASETRSMQEADSGAKVEQSDKSPKTETSEKSDKTPETTKTTESEKDEDQKEKVVVTSPDSTSDKSDKSDKSDDDDDDDAKGGAKSPTTTLTSAAESGGAEDVQRGAKEPKPSSTQSKDHDDGTDATDGTREEAMVKGLEKEVVEELQVKVAAPVAKMGVSRDSSEDDTELVRQLKEELETKILEYESTISQLKAAHEEEVRQLTEELSTVETDYVAKIAELEDKHELQVKMYEDSLAKLREGVDSAADTEALEVAHQQELHDLEERLMEKHMNDLNNLATQHQSKLDTLHTEYQEQVGDLQKQLSEAQTVIQQYTDGESPIHSVPEFQAESPRPSTTAATQEKSMAESAKPESDQTEAEAGPQEPESEAQQPGTDTAETAAFSVHTPDDITESSDRDGTLEVGVQSLDTSRGTLRGVDDVLDVSRGTLRGVDESIDMDNLHFSEEDSDKSIDEGTQKSDRSTPTAMLQTLSHDEGGPTVKSLDDTIDSSIRVSEREDLGGKVKELEGEVQELTERLAAELARQDEQMERLEREKQEERNLVAMLRGDIDRLNTDRDALQSTNEHLLGLLSDAVKTYMSVEEAITKKMKTMMDKSGDKGHGQATGRPGSADKKKTTTPPARRKSPAVSPSSPAQPEDGDVQETSNLSNITDEGLDLSQRLSDSIFQGPDLASEEEELLIDSGSRLRSSVNHLLDMVEETTSQLLDTRVTQADMVDTIEDKGHDLEQLKTRSNDLEDRLKEEVERKDFLALELHKAEGLIEGYASERETLDQKIHNLEEEKETLVLDLETTKNKLLDLDSVKSENDRLQKEMTEQQELMTRNIGQEEQASRATEAPIEPVSEDKALLLEVSRLNSEARDKEEQAKQTHERYESRMRQLETNAEDMESHYNKLLDEKKQEITDLKLHVEALEKQMKAKKQFLEEQSVEREQEHEDYQEDLDKWKKMVQDLEKQNGAGSRLQREVDDLTEQLQLRIDQHSQALLEAEKYQREAQDKDLSITELKTIIGQLEQDLQDKTQQLESNQQKLKKFEEELSKRPYPEDDLTDSSKSGSQSLKSALSLEFEPGHEGRAERAGPQMTVDEEMRQAAKKTKEELVREKFTLQSQVNEHLVQISSLRTQLDDMRYQRTAPGDGDTPDAATRLELERERSEEKDKRIAELKLQVEELGEKVDNREQQIEQLRDQRKPTRGSPVEAVEFERDAEIDKQIQTLKKENKQLRERVKLADISSTTDMSGLSQNLIDEKNQEIDHLSEQIMRLQADLKDLKSEKGVENLYDEVEILRDELQQKEREMADVNAVRVSAAFTDHSLTPDSSLINVGASFSEKASIQQEMQESAANNMEKIANLEAELMTQKADIQLKEDHIDSLEEQLGKLKEQLHSKADYIDALEQKQVGMQGSEDEGFLQAMIQEKESLISQLTVEVESLHTEVTDLSDFQGKLQEDYETVQNMLEEKYKEIEALTKELTDKSPTQESEEHALVIKHEVEIARLKKDLREKDNVIDEKLEEMAELTDKLELLESHLSKYKLQAQDYDEQIITKEKEVKKLRKDLDQASVASDVSLASDERDGGGEIVAKLTKQFEIDPSIEALTPAEKSNVIYNQRAELEALKEQVREFEIRPVTEDEKSEMIEKQRSEIRNQLDEINANMAEISENRNEIEALRVQLEAASLGQPAPWEDEAEVEQSQSNLNRTLKTEVEHLKQQIADARLTEDDKFMVIRDLRLENETLKKQLDSVLKMRPESPMLDDDEKSAMIRDQKTEIEIMKREIEAALKIKPPSPPMSPRTEEEKTEVIKRQEKEIAELNREIEAALQVTPPSPPKSPRSDEEVTQVLMEQELAISKLQEEERERESTLKRQDSEIDSLKQELDRVTEAIENGEQQKLVKEKVDETVKLKAELHEMKKKLDSMSISSVGSIGSDVASLAESVQEKEMEIKKKDKELQQSEELVKRLEEELDSVKEVKAYEDEIERQEKQDEIEELQAEVERLRSRTESSIELDIDMSSEADSRTDGRRSETDSKRALSSVSKEEFDEKVSEVKELKSEKEKLERELRSAEERLSEASSEEKVEALEKELSETKDELSKERLDSIQAIKDLEALRDRKERERRDSVRTIQDLEHDLDEKASKEKEMGMQLKQLSDELITVKRQYSIDGDKSSSESSRASPKSVEAKSDSPFELAADVDTLQQQVMQYKQYAEKTKDVLAEKQKYQTQLVKLEIQYEQLQKTMKKEVEGLENQLKAAATQQDLDVWSQLHATQERLERTTEQLTETANRLNETEMNFKQLSVDLDSRNTEMKDLQKELQKTSGEVAQTGDRLKVTEGKLKQALGQVSERDEQIHQLQDELESEQRSRAESVRSTTPPEDVDRLREQLKSTETELEAVKTSLKEAVSMGEQQLHLIEDKDQEYVKLKLDIQQTIADKDKMIREQRQKLKDKEQEVVDKDTALTQSKEEMTKLKSSQSRETTPSPAEDQTSVASLRSQLQNQEEVILGLMSDLSESRSSIQDRESEIEDIHRRNEQRRKDENETVESMNNQISGLQTEVEELRSVVKSQSQSGSSPRGSGDSMVGRDIDRAMGIDQRRTDPAYDQSGRRVSPTDEVRRRSPTDGADYRAPQDSRSMDRNMSASEALTPSRRRSPDQSSPPEQAAGETFVEGRQSYVEDDSGRMSFEPSGRERSPHFSPEGQSLSPRQLRRYVVDRGQGPQQQRPDDVVLRSEASQSLHRHPQSPPTRDVPHGRGQIEGEGQRSVSPTRRSGSPTRRSPSSDRQLPDDERRSSPTDRRSPPRDRSDRGESSFVLEGDRLVYESQPSSARLSSVPYEAHERYVGEDGQLYDRDGNIRPRYTQATESQAAAADQGQAVPSSRSYEGQSDVQRSRVDSRSSRSQDDVVDLQGQSQGQPESVQGQGEGQAMSPQAERYIQQLRRELLITKTALMQIQRGDRLDSAEGLEDLDLAEVDRIHRQELDDDVATDTHAQARPATTQARRQLSPSFDRGDRAQMADVRYAPIPDEQDINHLQRTLEKTQEELELYRTSSNLSARDFVQKVMKLKEELSSEHARHIQGMNTRAQQDTETQLAAMRIKYTDEIDHINQLHLKQLEQKLRDQQQTLDRRHKSETNRLVIQHQDEITTLKSRAGLDFDESSIADQVHRQGLGDGQLTNGHSAGAEPISARLQSILRRLHNEGVQVLSISELELLNRRSSQGPVAQNANLESMKAGWENERQSMISTIQSLKDLLAQTHKLRGLDKADDNEDEESSLEGSDWRAELLRAIGYVFTKERDTLLAELRSHVLSNPESCMDEIQRLEQKIRNMESHHHAAQDQIFNADRQSMLAEIRDLRAHATIARMHQHDERDRYNEKVANTEDAALKKERQLKQEVQLLEFKIQQEKILQDDLRTSLDVERYHSNDLSHQLNQEKGNNLDLQTNVTSLQTQVAKLRENLEQEQSRYISVTNALEEEKSKSLNLSDLLESERQVLWRTQTELDSLKQGQTGTDVQQLQSELVAERERRCNAESQYEVQKVTLQNLRQELDMARHRQQAIETELGSKAGQLQKSLENERVKQEEVNRTLERERSLANHLQHSLDVEKSHSHRQNSQDQVALEDLALQLEAERANLDDLNRALQREQADRNDFIAEKNMLKDHLDQERTMNRQLKQDVDKLQFDRLEAVNNLQKERDAVTRLRSECDKVTEDLRRIKSLEVQRDNDRESERLVTKKSVREADRQKDDFRMKLHEQEMENKRLRQKLLGLEDQLAETQESELRVIRELEQLKLDVNSHPEAHSDMVSVQTSPRHDSSLRGGDTSAQDQYERHHVYRSQLESMCQSLHYLVLRCREQVNKASHGANHPADISDFETLQKSLRGLLSEVKQLQEMEGDFLTHPSSSVNERILRQNDELTNFVARISEEKTELRNTMVNLEEEIWRYRQMDAKYQNMQRSADSTSHQFSATKAEWAKERLSLQMALNSAEREIALLQADLRTEREKRVASGVVSESVDVDKAKFQQLYGKYLRVQSFRKALIYQKKYLLLLLGGYQDTEETTLALLSSMGATEAHRNSPRKTRTALLTTFRGAVRAVIAIHRMKYLVKKWRRATRVGSEVVGGTIDQSNGYVPNVSTYSSPRHRSSSPRTHVRRAASPPPRNVRSDISITSPSSRRQRQPSPSRLNVSDSTGYVADTAGYVAPRFDYDTYSSSSYQSPRVPMTTTSLTHVPSTPPTKDYSTTTKYTPSSGARRKILASSGSIPAPPRSSGRVRFSAHETGRNGDLGEDDEYIHRLENLQTRLGTLENGKKGSWKQAWR